MIKSKYFLSFVVILIIILVFAGCNNSNNNNNQNDAVNNNLNLSENNEKDNSNQTNSMNDDYDVNSNENTNNLDNIQENTNTNSVDVNISELEVGDRVMDPSWTWEFRTQEDYVAKEGDVTTPVTWIVVAKDHYDSGGIVLLAENLIGYFRYDTSTVEGILAGQNHWGNTGTGNASSGIRPWLNSNDIHEGEGFYNAFSEKFKSMIITTTVPNREYENGENYVTNDKVFIPSSTELGDTDLMDTYEIGHVYEYFKDSDDDMRTAFIPEDGWGNRNYWLRNPINKGYRVIGIVYDSGFFAQEFADSGNTGIRPVVCVENTLQVSSEPNEEGIYIIK